MIHSIHLINFQSHADTTVVFNKGFNCIVGTSSSGKTAILRAIYCVATNRGCTASKIRTGEKSFTIELTVEYKGKLHTIKRVRDRGSCNQYFLDTQLYDVVGRDVPAEILEVLNLQDINIQKQLDLPYLVLESPGEVARVFNRYTALEEGEKVVTTIASDIRSTQAKRETVAKEVEQYSQAVKALAWIDAYEKLVTEYTREVEDRKHLFEYKARLAACVSSCEQTEARWAAANSDTQTRRSRVDLLAKYEKELSQLASDRITKIQRSTRLQSVASSIGETQVCLADAMVKADRASLLIVFFEKAKGFVTQREELSLKRMRINLVTREYEQLVSRVATFTATQEVQRSRTSILTQLEGDVESREGVEQSKRDIQSFLSQFSTAEHLVETAQTAVTCATDEKKRVVLLLTQNGICPLCESSLDEQHCLNVVENLA